MSNIHAKYAVNRTLGIHKNNNEVGALSILNNAL